MSIEVYVVFIVKFSCILGIFKRLLKSFEIKNVSLSMFLFIFQNFERIKVLINLNPTSNAEDDHGRTVN